MQERPFIHKSSWISSYGRLIGNFNEEPIMANSNISVNELTQRISYHLQFLQGDTVAARTDANSVFESDHNAYW